MKTTYNEFFEIAPNYKRFISNQSARFIFENILSKDENIIAMIDATIAKKPALVACVSEIEDYCSKLTDGSFDLSDNFTKQALGAMVRAILLPFGYESFRQKDMPKNTSKFVVSAMSYTFKGNATMRVVRRIESC